jgi:hypothetical protein
MNIQEAKFILGAYRPNGRDAADPMFAEALGQAERDPELRAWLERERKFDTAFAGRLRDIAPPAELRAAILAGARASRPRRRWWTHPLWLAAAAIAIIAAVSIDIVPSAEPKVSELAAFALSDLVEAHDEHVGYPPELASLQDRLGAVQLPLTAEPGIGIDLDELRRLNCRSVRIAGREVFEICFVRDGTWYHLYVARRNDFAPGPVDPNLLIQSRGEYVATAWADARNVYALVTHGQEALRQVI